MVSMGGSFLSKYVYVHVLDRKATNYSSKTELTSFRQIRSRRFWLSPVEPPFIGYVQSIALSPVDPRIMSVGIEFGAVVRSHDGGQTWTDHRKGALRDCHSLTFHVSNGDWVYEVGGTGAGVSVSRDAGATWMQPKAGYDQRSETKGEGNKEPVFVIY